MLKKGTKVRFIGDGGLHGTEGVILLVQEELDKYYVEFESDNHLKFKNRKIDKLKDLIQLRNEGLVITRYFLTNIEVEKYLLKMIGN